MIKIWFPFSFQLWKVEVINTYLTKFQVKIPVGRPIYFEHNLVLLSLLNVKIGRESQKDLALVGTRGM